jgi:hypothetical protein
MAALRGRVSQRRPKQKGLRDLFRDCDLIRDLIRGLIRDLIRDLRRAPCEAVCELHQRQDSRAACGAVRSGRVRLSEFKVTQRPGHGPSHWSTRAPCPRGKPSQPGTLWRL